MHILKAAMLVGGLSLATGAVAQSAQAYLFAEQACSGDQWARRGYWDYNACYDAHVAHYDDVHGGGGSTYGGEAGGGGGGGGGSTFIGDIKGYGGGGEGCSGSRLSCRNEH